MIQESIRINYKPFLEAWECASAEREMRSAAGPGHTVCARDPNEKASPRTRRVKAKSITVTEAKPRVQPATASDSDPGLLSKPETLWECATAELEMREVCARDPTGLVIPVSSHESATFRAGGGHF